MLRRIWRFYSEDLPLKFKFLFINIIIFFAMAISAYFIVMQTYRDVKETTIASENALVTQTATSVATTFNNIKTVMNSLASMPFLSRMTYTDDLDDYFSDIRTATYAKDFFSTVSTLENSFGITAIRVYTSPEYEQACTQYPFSDVLQPSSSIRSSYWHGIFSGDPGRNDLLCPSFYLTKREKDELGQLAYIQRYDGGILQDEDDTDPTFWLAVYFSLPELEAILTQNMPGTQSVYYIINSRSNLVASSNATLSGLYFMDYNKMDEVILSSQDFSETTILGVDLFMTYREIRGTDWRLVSVIPVSSVTGRQQKMYRRMTFAYLLLSIVALTVEFLLSNRIASRIAKVTKVMTKRKRNTPDKLETHGEKDEIGQLVSVYNDTMDQILELMEIESATAQKLRTAEVRALQAQINPHFLYNMFDMINWLSLSGNQHGVSEAVQYLSRFYKLTLSSQDIFVSLQEELYQVELYVHLQNMRFDHGINFIVDVSEEYLECKIPHLILQPIVENAIIHGICEREDKTGDIVIMCWSEPTNKGEDLIITISDTGVGIEPEQLLGILSDYEQPAVKKKSSGTNIAISNTHQRLRLIYGDSYGLSYSSVPKEGTEVTVRIPL